jgi:hypothetical protein
MISESTRTGSTTKARFLCGGYFSVGAKGSAKIDRMELLKTCTYRHSVLVIMEDGVKAIDGCADDFRHGGARGKGRGKNCTM